MESAETRWPELLTPQETSAYLAAVHGIQAVPSTLTQWRYRGTGPRFQKNGSRVRYPRTEVDAFAKVRITTVVASTAELSNRKRRAAAQQPAQAA